MNVYLGFRNSDSKMLSLLKEGFRHIDITVELDDTEWMLIVPSFRQLRFYKVKEAYPHNCTDVIKINVPDKEGYALPHLTTCVGLAKFLLGLRTWHFTPYQLYKYLIRKKEVINGNRTIKRAGETTASRTNAVGSGEKA
jgi:hypothetical protein